MAGVEENTKLVQVIKNETCHNTLGLLILKSKNIFTQGKCIKMFKTALRLYICDELVWAFYGLSIIV